MPSESGTLQLVRTLVIDDESLAREHLRTMLRDERDIEVVGEASSGSAAISQIRATKPDLVFLDIQMPGCTGFDVIRAVQPDVPSVIFVTAYDQHALQAFEVAAVDYLLKPVAESRLRAAVRRAVDRLRATSASEIAAQLTALVHRLPQARTRIPLHADGRVTFIEASDVDWIEAADDHVRLHAGKAVYVMRETMTSMAARLPSDFVRIHRSFMVNSTRIREVQTWVKGDFVVILQDGTRLTSGRTYRDRVRALLE